MLFIQVEVKNQKNKIQITKRLYKEKFEKNIDTFIFKFL